MHSSLTLLALFVVASRMSLVLSHVTLSVSPTERPMIERTASEEAQKKALRATTKTVPYHTNLFTHLSNGFKSNDYYASNGPIENEAPISKAESLPNSLHSDMLLTQSSYGSARDVGEFLNLAPKNFYNLPKIRKCNVHGKNASQGIVR